MDDKNEDWGKWKRIKAEREKALKDVLPDEKANLQFLDAQSFAARKGFSRDPEAYRVGSEKIAGTCLVVIILGVILDILLTFVTMNLKMGLADIIPAKIENLVFTLLMAVPALAAVFALIEALVYCFKTRRKLIAPIIESIITILIFVIYWWAKNFLFFA